MVFALVVTAVTCHAEHRLTWVKLLVLLRLNPLVNRELSLPCVHSTSVVLRNVGLNNQVLMLDLMRKFVFLTAILLQTQKVIKLFWQEIAKFHCWMQIIVKKPAINCRMVPVYWLKMVIR